MYSWLQLRLEAVKKLFTACAMMVAVSLGVYVTGDLVGNARVAGL